MAGPVDPQDAAGHRQRLRDRFLDGEGEAFRDYELLEYVLGLAIPRKDTKGIAKALLAEFRDLPGVLAALPKELARVEGMTQGAVAAMKFIQAVVVRTLRSEVFDRPVLSGWQALTDYLHAQMAYRLTEEFRVIYLDSRNVLLRDEMRQEAMGQGTVNAAPVYPRRILQRAFELGASSVILVHNHPSGDPSPSRDDIVMTKAIIEAGRHVGLAVHDHVIISRSGHASMRALGLI